MRRRTLRPTRNSRITSPAVTKLAPAPPETRTHTSSSPPRMGAITWRSVLLGLLGVVVICTVTPFNDYALNNTAFVGNNLPLGVVGLTFLFVLLVAGPLNRLAPQWRLSSGELAVALSMTLVGCALPSSGLMRYFPPSLVSPFWMAQRMTHFQPLLDALHLPPWLFPTFEGDGPRPWMNDPVVNGYLERWTGDGPIPYAAWVRPALMWAIFVFALYGALLCMVTLVRRQWHENERLPFPLAQIQLALIEQPRAGRWLNDVFASRGFRIAFAAVFLIHAWNGLAQYLPRYFPPVPLSYNFAGLFTEPPLSYAPAKVTRCALYFIVAGTTFFLSTSVAFSLWFFVVIEAIYVIAVGVSGGDTFRAPQAWDQHAGGVIAFALLILWVGRNHWRLILAQAFRGARPGEPQGR